MYLLKCKRGIFKNQNYVFDSAKLLLEFVEERNILKFSVIKLDRWVAPAPKEQNPRIDLQQRLVPLSQAASDEVKL